MALQRLAAIREEQRTAAVYDEDSMPSEMRVKRLFSALSQNKRAASRVAVDAE